jgi:hypothetical protein
MPKTGQWMVLSCIFSGLTVDGRKVLLGLIVELLGLLFKLIKSALGIGIDSIFGVLANVELDFELLRRTHNALLEAFETHTAEDSEWESEEVAKAG